MCGGCYQVDAALNRRCEMKVGSVLDAEPPRHDTDDIANASLRPEIVIGLVGALGTDLAVVQKELKNALMSVGYGSTVVRVSELIERNYGWLFNGSSSLSRLDELMDIGDALREDTKYEAAAAALAVSEISTARHDEFESLNASGDGELSDALWERDSRATIIRSLKHPDEVRLLRSVYGPRFVLLAAWSPRVEREKDVGDRLRQYHSTKDEAWVSSNVTRLLDRDEEDSERDFGQQVRDAFELADFYLALIPGRSVEGSLGRLVRLLFGHPYETPTWQEQAMYQASGARLRSSAAGRQVGAVIVDGAGELLVTGVNEAPKAGGGQYWTDDELDHRDFRYGYDVNERQQLSIIMDVLWRLQKANWLG